MQSIYRYFFMMLHSLSSATERRMRAVVETATRLCAANTSAATSRISNHNPPSNLQATASGRRTHHSSRHKEEGSCADLIWPCRSKTTGGSLSLQSQHYSYINTSTHQRNAVYPKEQEMGGVERPPLRLDAAHCYADARPPRGPQVTTRRRQALD
jgi:hypothetical protein